jgi:hypothetical protein
MAASAGSEARRRAPVGQAAVLSGLGCTARWQRRTWIAAPPPAAGRPGGRRAICTAGAMRPAAQASSLTIGAAVLAASRQSPAHPLHTPAPAAKLGAERLPTGDTTA